MASILLTAALISVLIVNANACDFHYNQIVHPHLGSRQHTRQAARREVFDWEYSRSFDWHTIRPEYAICNTGTNQSPINLLSTQGLAVNHKPSFAGYEAHPEITGTLSNWGFGPAYTLAHSGADFSTLPSLVFDDQILFLRGWHIHFPSEHLIDRVRSRAEMHLVHVDAAGTVKAVVGIRVDSSRDPTVKSAFIESLPTLLHFNDTAEVEGVVMNPMSVIEEVGGVSEYWTYQGSLTTPPCTEGVRWFVSKETLMVSIDQMVRLKGVARFSRRVEQEVWLHQINV